MFSLETLQFSSLLKLVARGAQTPMGEDRLLGLRPHSSRIELENDLLALKETLDLEKEDVSWSFSELPDPKDSISLLKIRNTSLEPAVLRELARLISQSLAAKNAIQSFRESKPTLWRIVENIPKDLSKTAQNIEKKILPSGELDDSASPELNRIRREINSQRASLTRSLENLMRSKSDAVQDDIVTVRNGRFVVPVKANFSGQIGGVAHGTSSSGATVFIEPLDSIEANNELQRLKAKEENEILRILFSLSDELRQNLSSIETAASAIAELDFIKAKTVFARNFNATVPVITEDESLDLVNARHPLLEESLKNAKSEPGAVATGSTKQSEKAPEIVPVSFALSKQNSVMIISGANAGGKTVVLKTAGLLSVMAVSGLPVPAEAAKIPFYVSVLADIGDHQSLTANLSTFSSHISNIAEMIEKLHTPALVLLDEVGTGTDPEEGSALGVAIVDHLRNRGAQIIASTHYNGLKIYAANDEDVINASVEFDEKTLEPTYKLLTGIAGASSGLEIARRFGISDEVIAKARENLDVSAQAAEDYLHKLQSETKQAHDLRVALDEEREATAEKYAKLDVEFRKRERQRRKQFDEELSETVESFERRSKAFIKTVEDKKQRTKLEKELVANKAELKRHAFNAKAKMTRDSESSGQTNSDSSFSKEEIIADAEVKAGSDVILTRFGTKGRVEKIDGDSAEVVVGSMRMKQKLEDLQVAASQEKTGEKQLEKLKRSAAHSNIDLELGAVQSELNLIGQTTLDAEAEIDKFLDDSYVSKLQKVRIIHGFGTGALKNSVHQFLKGHPHVDNFGFAPQNEGGNGATIVELKQ
ncbi:MAG: endonuclease MutS2 [Pyrinomonadaceae bacterium]